jgi:drug/metabolite transporter (DMT)-like permease
VTTRPEADGTNTAAPVEVRERQARRQSPFWLWIVQGYLFAYLFIVALGFLVDTLLRSHLDAGQRDVVNLLAWVTTVLYALALVVLLLMYASRLRLRHHRSKSLWLLFLGLAGLLVARGYFSASLLVPNVPQGDLSLVMSDVGLGAGTAIVLGMIWGAVDGTIYAARQARERARHVRLPRFRRGARGQADGAEGRGGE